jgi:hypothetical protein
MLRLTTNHTNLTNKIMGELLYKNECYRIQGSIFEQKSSGLSVKLS